MHEPYSTDVQIPRPNQFGGQQWIISGLTNVTVVFGKNGSGKSLLLRAWRDSDPQSCHYVVPERGGEIDYQAQYLQQQIDANERRGNSQRNFVDQYRRQIIGRIPAYFSFRGGNRTDQKTRNPAELEALLNRLLPDFTIELVATKYPPYNLMRAIDDSRIENIEQLSSGEVQLLTVALTASVAQRGRADSRL